MAFIFLHGSPSKLWCNVYFDRQQAQLASWPVLPGLLHLSTCFIIIIFSLLLYQD